MKNPRGLAVDWIGERIYILDGEENHITSTDLNGGEQVSIVSSGPQPLDIVVDPSSRTIFWSTLENGILSASMDGTNKQALIERGIEWATGLSIDYPTNRLYWADHRKGTIETALLNGKSRHIVTQFEKRSKFTTELSILVIEILNLTNAACYLLFNSFQPCYRNVFKYSKIHCI